MGSAAAVSAAALRDAALRQWPPASGLDPAQPNNWTDAAAAAALSSLGAAAAALDPFAAAGAAAVAAGWVPADAGADALDSLLLLLALGRDCCFLAQAQVSGCDWVAP